MIGTKSPEALRAWSGEIWLLVQATAAATVAWVIAKQIGDHSDPFFAPIAAVVALSFARGERGLSAVRLLTGVGIGIVAGELMVILLGSGTLSLALAIFIAVIAARLAGAERLLRNQAAAAAILTVVVPGGEAGFDRLIDALIGAGVALFFSQVLFTPLPVALVRRSERAAIGSMGDGLRVIADAIERDERLVARVAADRLRAVREELTELARAVRASRRVVQHSLLWRSQRGALARVTEDADRLDLLGAGCLMLLRTAVAVPPAQAQILVTPMRQLADILADLATGLDDPATRRRAADRVHEVIVPFVEEAAPADAVMRGAVAGLRLVVHDVTVFARGPQ